MMGVIRYPLKVYEEVKDFEILQTTVEEYLGEFNGESKQPMHLVMFGDAIEHVSRISRVIRCDLLDEWLLFSQYIAHRHNAVRRHRATVEVRYLRKKKYINTKIHEKMKPIALLFHLTPDIV